MPKKSALNKLLQVMARLRAPDGCPWDRQQDHQSIRFHAVEEAYELVDAIETKDDHEIVEELGDLLLQVVFHCQLAKERGSFDFERVADHLVQKLVRRHPHVFGGSKVKSVAAVWAQWDRIKKGEKEGTRHARPSALDGIPKHLPALMRAEKLVKKAKKAGLPIEEALGQPAMGSARLSKAAMAKELLALAAYSQKRGWAAETLLRSATKQIERKWGRQERSQARKAEKPRAA